MLYFSGGSGVRLAGLSVLRVRRQHGRPEVLDGPLCQGVPRGDIMDVGREGYQHGHSVRLGNIIFAIGLRKQPI